MKLISLYAVLFIIIRSELFHSIYAFPQTSSDLKVTNPLNPIRNKRAYIFDMDFHKSILSVVNDAKKHNLNDIKSDEKHALTTVHQSSIPTVNISVSLIMPPPTNPTYDGKPFDLPQFISKTMDSFKESLSEFNTNVKSEVNKLVTKATDGEVAKSIITSAKDLEQISKKIEVISGHMGGVIQSLDTMSKNIDDGSKSIGGSIGSGATSIGTGIETGSKSIQQTLQNNYMGKVLESGLSSIEKNLQKNFKIIQGHSETRAKGIEKSINSGVEFLDNSVQEAVRSINLSEDKRAKSLEDLMENGTSNIEKGLGESSISLKKIADFVENVPPGAFDKMEQTMDHIADLHLQSQVFETIGNLLENMKEKRSAELKMNQDTLTMHIAKLANRISDDRRRTKINDINYDISKIDMNGEIMNLGTQLERLGAEFEYGDTPFVPGIKTGQLLKTVGAFIKFICLNKKNV